MRQHSSRHTIARLVLCVLAAQSFVSAAPAHASAVYDPNLIISDLEIRRSDSMGLADIMSFLETRGGLNRHGFGVNDYVWGKDNEAKCAARLGLGIAVTAAGTLTDAQKKACDPLYGEFMGAAQMIHEAAQRYAIDPRYILARIEMEQSLVSSTVPTQTQLDWAAGYALCGGCQKSSARAQQYKGLAKQIDAAAGWMDWFLTAWPTLSDNYCKPNAPCTIGGGVITPGNAVTAALANYTPHIGGGRIGGNRLFWRIWQRWWGPSYVMEFPEGSLVQNADTGAVGLIQNGMLRPIASPSVLATRYASVNIIPVEGAAFDAFHKEHPGANVSFPDLALVRTELGERYLLVRDTKRLIPSDEVFRSVGFNPEEIEDVLASALEDYRPGTPISADESYPAGALLQDASTGGVYYVESGTRYPIWDRAVLHANFPGLAITQVSPASLETLPKGAPVMLRDGVLVKSPDSATVYVIAGGAKRSIPSEEVFYAYGYRFTNVLTVSSKLLQLHPDGLPLELIEVPAEPTPPPDAALPATEPQIS